MLELFSMLFQACGAKFNIKEEFFDEADVDDVVVALVDLARNICYSSFLILLLIYLARFLKCFDDSVFLVLTLSSSPPRIHRQAASLMGLQLVKSFISVAKILAEQRDTTQRQLNARKGKRTKGPFLEQLNDRRFSKRFSNRIIEMVDDVDLNVAVSSIGLIKQLVRHQLLPDDNLHPLYDDLLIDSKPEIRHVIGELDWKCIISMLLDEDPLVELTEEVVTNLIRLLFASVRKAVGEKIVLIDNEKQRQNKAQKEIFENNSRNITIAMMKNYPSLLQKFLADMAKVPLLVEIIMHMSLELYSLKRQEEGSCKILHNKLRDLEDELTTKLKSAIKEVMDGKDEYTLLINLKKIYELQLSRPLLNESLYENIITVLHSFRNLNDEITSFLLLNIYVYIAWSLNAIIKSETISEASLSSLMSKRDNFFTELEYFLNTYPKVGEEHKSATMLACRVSIFALIHEH
ncbi:hypothetical protein REPUB_Repub13aG0257100 [Reevesia pubescens]